jgi:predicted AlkP superfamily pyrophosphatase or phosphodiesterase
MKKSIILSLALLSGLLSTAQEQPKLIVGVIVDQMRMDYIYRYWDKFGDDGFKRLIGEGYLCKNAHFDYIPTKTGPGHASVYTGTSPMNHGIIANDWFDKRTGEEVYCASDPKVNPLGCETDAGRMSPHRMLAPSLGDAVRISNNFKGKSIGISLKDRGAILPAGHSANAAYWMDYKTGAFVSSDYYLEALPKWVTDFNTMKHADRLAEDPWTPMLSLDQYTESIADDNPYERVYNPNGKPVFPYDIQSLIKKKGYYAFASSPYGNTILRMLAEKAIVEEDMGQDDHLDLLAVSFSSPDIIGHAFGPQSIEIEDTYLRLDHEIGRLLKTLDDRVGERDYLFFLTADHAAAPVPAFMEDNNIPIKLFNTDRFMEELNADLLQHFGEGEWIRSFSNEQLFLNHELRKEKGVDASKLYEHIRTFLLEFEGIAQVFDRDQLGNPVPDNGFAQLARNGWNQQRSGDIMIQYLPGWMDYSPQGTTHGSAYNYDTHVPLIFYGYNIPTGTLAEKVDITQIAGTVSILSSIAFPHLANREVINELLEEVIEQDVERD